MSDGGAGKGAAFALALLAIILLSTNSAAVVVTAGDFDPLLFSLGATLVSLLAFGPRLIRPSGRRSVAALLRLPWFRLAIVLKTVNDLAFYFVMITTQQIEAAVIVYLYPIFNLLLGSVILEKSYRRPGAVEWGLVGLSFVSILLLTPIYALASLSAWGFATAMLSAAASVYVVLLQAASDRAGLSREEEGAAIGALFAGSLVLHVVAMALGQLTGLWGWPAAVSLTGQALLWPILGILWVGVVVNVLSEGLWLRASRLYRVVSLKSLFYLSPVLTAIYFAALDIDDLSRVVVFCLAGVVVSNYMLHDREIDDPSLIAFLFGLVGSATFFKLVSADPIPAPILVTQDSYQTFITFTVVIVGFLLARSLNLSQDNSARLLELSRTILPELSRRGLSEADCEVALQRIAAQPDVFAWSDADRSDVVGRALAEVLAQPDAAPVYLGFLNGRQVGVSRPEIILTLLLCGVAALATVSQALQAERGYFLASFSVGVLLFIPMLIREYTGQTAARQYAGVVVRRTLGVMTLDPQARALPGAKGRFVRSARLRTWLFAGLSLAVATATWAMLYDLG